MYGKIQNFLATLKHWQQRAVKGYSYRDVWHIDTWFETIMPQMLTDLKQTKHGVPNEFCKHENSSKEEIEEAIKAWDEVLDRMIFCFREMSDNTCSHTNEFEEEYYKQKYKSRKNKRVNLEPCEVNEADVQFYRMKEGEVEPQLAKQYWDRLNEIEAYKKGMQEEALDLFKKYFRNLWD